MSLSTIRSSLFLVLLVGKPNFTLTRSFIFVHSLRLFLSTSSASGFLFSRKSLEAFLLQGFWQREKDSNPHKQSQSLSCYPYTIPLGFVFCDPQLTSAGLIIAKKRKLSRGFLKFFENFFRWLFRPIPGSGRAWRRSGGSAVRWPRPGHGRPGLWGPKCPCPYPG